MKYFTYIFLIISLSCSGVKIKSENVHVEIVQRSSVSIDSARSKLLSHQCAFLKNIVAPIASGEGSEEMRSLAGLKNKTASEGGNAVISSLFIYTDGKKIFTKGMIYHCPEDHSTENV